MTAAKMQDLVLFVRIQNAAFSVGFGMIMQGLRLGSAMQQQEQM